MADLSFDDLIPGAQKSAALSFDDLIPAQKQAKAEDVAKAMMLRGMGSSASIFGQMAPDVAMGAKQVWDAGAQMLGRAVTGGPTSADTAANQTKAAYEQAAQPAAFSGPRGFPSPDIARGIGQAMITGPLLGGAASTIPRMMVQGAAGGAASNVLTPDYSQGGDFWRQKLDQAKEGALAGGATAGVLGSAGRVLSPNVSQDVRTLLGSGVTPTPGQVMGGIGQSLENKATSVPLLGDAINVGRNRALDEFNRAVYTRTLAPLGKEGIDVAKSVPVGSEGIAKVGNFLSDKYSEVLPKITVLRDGALEANIAQLRTMVNGSLPKQQAEQFANIVDSKVLSKFTDKGLMAGETMKQVDSDLGKLVKGYKGFNNDFDQQQLGDAIRQLQSNLRGAVARSSPANAPTVRAIDQGWTNLTQMENAGSMLGAKNGIFSPAQYLNAVKKSDLSARDRAFARGEVRNQDLATAGDNTLSNRYPDSGSIGRAIVGLGLGGGLGMINPAIPAAGAIGSLAYTPWGQKALAGLLARRPESAQATGDLLKKVAPYLGLAAPAGLLGQ